MKYLKLNVDNLENDDNSSNIDIPRVNENVKNVDQDTVNAE